MSQTEWEVEHDGFQGVEIGTYRTHEGKEGVVLQQIGTKVVHVYARKWLKRITTPPTNPSPARGEVLRRAYKALNSVAEFMRKDVQSGDSDLWTPEYENIHDEVIVVREQARAALAHGADTREALAGVGLKIAEKISQLRHYRDNQCQLDHAKTIAEGRISQAEMDLRWINEAIAALKGSSTDSREVGS